MKWARGAVICLAMAACAGSGSGAPLPLGEELEGIATWYDATGEGACGFDRSADRLVAAINSAQYVGSAACGACLAVDGPSGTVTVQVVDECPDCGANHLDLSQEAFARLAAPSQGRISVRWRPVKCDVSGNLAYHFKDGSSQWWTAIQIRNHRVPVASLEWSSAGTWQEIRRERWNYFVVPKGVGSGPLALRVRSSDGQALEDTLPGPADDQTFVGRSQFR